MFDTRLEKVQDLSEPARTALSNAGLGSTARVWQALVDDPQLIARLPLGDAARADCLLVLSQQASQEAHSINAGWFRGHLPDVLVFLLLCGLTGAWFILHRPKSSPPAKAEVSAAKAIAPFHILDAGDLAVSPSAGPESVSQISRLYIGRYATAQIPAGANLKAAPLSEGMRVAHQLDGLRIFNVSLRPSALLAGVPPPYKVDLFFSPHAFSDRGWSRSFTVYVLDLKPQGDALVAVIAASRDDTATLLSALPSGELVAAGPVQ